MSDRDVRAENLRLNAELHECYIEIARLRLALGGVCHATGMDAAKAEQFATEIIEAAEDIAINREDKPDDRP
jgi:hypothetical protein